MGRQLFLHHYLPAHLISCLVTGALVEFIFNVEPVTDELPNTSINNAASSAVQEKLRDKQQIQQQHDKDRETGRAARKHFSTAAERLQGQTMWPTWLATVVILLVVLYGFVFFFPLTYGWPGLDVAQVQRRKWLGYDLHFAK